MDCANKLSSTRFYDILDGMPFWDMFASYLISKGVVNPTTGEPYSKTTLRRVVKYGYRNATIEKWAAKYDAVAAKIKEAEEVAPAL